MSAEIRTIPVWKKGATPVEWLQEVVSMAMERPERFARIVVVHEELNAEGVAYKTRVQSFAIPTNTELLGVLEVAKLDINEHMRGRR